MIITFDDYLRLPDRPAAESPSRLARCPTLTPGPLCLGRLSLRDLAEVFLERGFVFTHEAAGEWEERFAPLLMERLRVKRRGKPVTVGLLTRPTSRSTAGGAISTGRSIGMATWSIHCSARRVIGRLPGASSTGLVPW